MQHDAGVMFAKEPNAVSDPIVQSEPKLAGKPRKTKPTVIEAAASPAHQPIVEETVVSPAEQAAEVFAAAVMNEQTVPDAQPASVEATAGVEPMATVAETYTTTANTATDKAQALFGDMNERAKAAFEKTQKMGEDMVEFHKGNLEAVVASARAAAKAGETLAQDAAEYGKKSFEHATSAFKGFASAKSPTEFFQLQSDFVRASFDGAVAEASRNSEKMVKVLGEVFQPLSSRYAVAAEKIKTPAL